MAEVRIIHYLNQFFAGIGGEERAHIQLAYRSEPLGPGRRIQLLLDNSVRIVSTVFCGDNYFALNRDIVLDSILNIAMAAKIGYILPLSRDRFCNFSYFYRKICSL